MSRHIEPTDREKTLFVGVLVAVARICAAAAVPIWFVSDNWQVRVASVAGAIFLFLPLFGVAGTLLDMYRRGRPLSRHVKTLQSSAARHEHLDAVASLRSLGEDAAFQLDEVKSMTGGGIARLSLEWLRRRELEVYILPGLRIAAFSGDPAVARAAVMALTAIGTTAALAVLNDVPNL